ncbi:DNA repair protein RecO [Aureivirga sp. CE67]|uniref:DNA repair protein RecO n=1 Tax=Aureivirga sp. CE67 TaxID=1788983 RepID=UPI0018C9F938|nr:DNA repair protein RecO [Aureivirga sp. CE67]
MSSKTKAIVLQAIKYKDTSLIVKCYTEQFGNQTYLLKGVLSNKKGKIKAAYFQPLTILNIVTNPSKKGDMNFIKEVTDVYHYKNIYISIVKQTIILFLSEVLQMSLKEESEHKELFEYIEHSLKWFDTQDKVANFHILFLFKLTRFLGFFPDLSEKNANYFDLKEGRFTNQFDFECIEGENLTIFKQLEGIKFDGISMQYFTNIERQNLLDLLLRFYELHIANFKKPKSLDILKSIFQ